MGTGPQFRRPVQQVWTQLTGEAEKRLVLLPNELPQASSPTDPPAPGPVREFRDYRNFFLRLPRPVRIIAYIAIIIFIPIYLSLSLKFVRDVFEEHLENLEIRAHLHEPRRWFSAEDQKFGPKFPQNWSRCDPPPKLIDIPDTDPKASLGIPGLALFRLDPLYDIYDFQAEMDITYHGQPSAAWAIRANGNGTEMYLFVLNFSRADPPLRLEAFDVVGLVPKKLYVSTPAPEFKPLTDKAVIRVHLWADACVFPVTLQVLYSDTAVQTVAYAEAPCRQHGTLGVGPLGESLDKTFNRVFVCSASESAKYSCGPDFATLLQNGSGK